MNVPGPVDGRGWATRLSRLLFPPMCMLCGHDGEPGRDLCKPCARDLPRNVTCCERCAVPLPHAASLCGVCLRRPPPFDAAFAPYRYDYPLDRLVQRFKFGRELAAGRVLAQLLADALHERALPVEVLVPVPLHEARLRERGFNQTLELARPLARALRVPCEHRVLRRDRATVAQTGLDARERRRNVRAAFEVGQDVRGRDVALLDDVVTTGATVRECARVLKQAGARSVHVIAVARAA